MKPKRLYLYIIMTIAQRVSDFMARIKTSIFGREELQAMASLGGASGKAWSIS